MRYASAFTLALVATFLPSTLAHGFLRRLTIDGKQYNGNTPNSNPFPSSIRLIDDITPVKGADSRAVNCGKNAQPAELVVAAKPGSTVSFEWAGGDGGNWPHNIGPMLTYLAKCGNTTCDKFDAINAEWFKIDEVGQRQGNLSEWVQQDLFDGKPTTVKLPQNMSSGQYLLRHEIIALHLANTKGGAEFYPSCSQIQVDSNNNTQSFAIEPLQTVPLPGAYKDTDPGIFVPTVFDPVKNYEFPGPAISNVVTSSSNMTQFSPRRISRVVTSSSNMTQFRPRRISRVMAQYRCRV